MISDDESFASEKLDKTVNLELSGNQGVTGDTEVLTPNGFRTYKTLKVGDSIYTWKDGQLNVNEVQMVNVYDYDGEMHEYAGRDFWQMVTPGHRVLYCNGINPIQIDKSENIIDQELMCYIPVALDNTRIDYAISDDDLDAVVLFLTRGYIETYDPNRRPWLRWYQSENRYGVDHFLSIMKRKNIQLTSSVSVWSAWQKGCAYHSYSLSKGDSEYYINLMEGTGDQLPDWMFKLSKRQAQRVIDLWAKTNGYNVDRLIIFPLKNAEGLQHVAMLAGYGMGQTDRYVRIIFCRNKAAVRRRRIHYKGKVWCPTTEDGIVIFRKDGKVFISCSLS